MIVLVAAAVTVAFLVISFLLSMRRPHPKFPPGPPRWPIVGNFFGMDLGGHWGKQLRDLSKIYGKTYGFKFGQFNYVILTDPSDIRELLNRDEAQGRPRLYYVDHMMNFENAGILMSEGQAWKEQRRFCLRHLRDYGFGKTSSEELVLDEFKELIATIRPTDAKDGEPWIIPLDKSLNAATANVIWWMLANKRVTAKDENFLKMSKSLEQIFKLDTILSQLSFMPSLLALCPKWVYGENKLVELRNTIYDCLRDVIAEHEQTLNPEEPRDLIDSFLAERQAREKPGVTETHFTDTMLIVTLLDLFNAGHETTATTLRWFYLYMMMYPEVQDKIHAEIDREIGRDRQPSWTDSPKMHYTVAAINELWRITSIVPNGADHSASATFECGGFVYPKGTCFLANIYGVHMDVRLWDDPENFRPERFLDKDGKFVKNENLMPFEVGKRQCMGESLARIVTFLGAVYMLQLFSFQKVDGEKYSLEPNLEHSIIISAPFPYKVKLVPRK